MAAQSLAGLMHTKKENGNPTENGVVQLGTMGKCRPVKGKSEKSLLVHTGISFARRAGRKSYIVFGSRDLSYGIMWGAFSICRSLLFMHFLLRGVVRQGMLIKEPLEQLAPLEQLELLELLERYSRNGRLGRGFSGVKRL